MKTSIQNLISCASLALLIAACSPGQQKPSAPVTPTFAIVEGHAPVWENAIQQMMDMADAMPEDMYGYRPHDSVRTFAEQLAHIAGSSKVIANMFLKDVRPDGPPPAMDVSEMSKDELKTMVRTSLEEAWGIMETMSDKQLLEETCQSFSGNTMSRLEGLLFVQDHLTNHKAKANLYMRVSGNEPPRYSYY